MASWHPLVWPRFQFNPVMIRAMPLLLGLFELLRIVPKGTRDTQACFPGIRGGHRSGHKTAQYGFRKEAAGVRAQSLLLNATP